MNITDFPQEILDEIFKNFLPYKPRRRVANLTSCALTCKVCLSPCQRYLFSAIRLLANEPAQQDRVEEFASIIQRHECPIRTYVRRLHLYFGSSEQSRMNLIIIFPLILPFLSNVQVLSIGSSAGEGVLYPDSWKYMLWHQAFTRFLRSPLLTTLVFSKVGFPALLGECPYVENLSVTGPLDIGFQALSPAIYKPQINSLSCGASLKTIQHLFPYFFTERQLGEEVSWLSPVVDISALRQLVLFPERGRSSDVTENFINYVADTLEDLDCGCIILPSKLKPMPHLRILKRWIHLPTNGPPEQTLNQLCDVLTHCTTTSKVIERITINLLVVQIGFQELVHLDWSDVDDVFETPPRMLKDFTLVVKYRGKPLQGKSVLRGDLQIALKSVMEQRMPNLTGMASAGPDVFKFSFIAL